MSAEVESAVARVLVSGDRPYAVAIGTDLLSTLPAQLSQDVVRVAIIHAPVMRERAALLRNGVVATGRHAITIELPDAEHAKTAATLESCWAALGQAGFTRSDVVVGLGGGATTDLAGFVAATWLRGVALIQVPTTLLGMVDAAVGGKTGINTAEGKNLVGAFYAPALVSADLSLLVGMPSRDYVAGLAEVIKCGFIADPVILELIEQDPVAASDPTSELTAELVRRAVQVKADVVSDDFTEVAGIRPGGGIGREVLNYGHTLAHAIEHTEDYRWRHGDAVSVGLVFAAELARHTGHLSDEVADRHHRVLERVGLPTTYRLDQWPALAAAMTLDKKTRGNELRFVILDGIASPTILRDPNPGALAHAFQRLTSRKAATDG